jgi:glycosyltransferase involved in cell wall biosynthesis
MPIYNEEASIEKTFNEWFNALNEQSFFSIVKFVLLNDGSKDKTLSIINEIAVKYPESVHVIDKKNTGHGHSCLVGYQFAVKEKFDFTMPPGLAWG